MILIDANIFLELALDQENADQCAALLSAVAEGKIEALVTHFAVHAVEASLRRGPHLAEFLQNIERSKGLRIHDTSSSDEVSASLLAEKMGKDFDDGLEYFVAKKLGMDAIVSFDRHLDGLDLRRVIPKQALEEAMGVLDAHRTNSAEYHSGKRII